MCTCTFENIHVYIYLNTFYIHAHMPRHLNNKGTICSCTSLYKTLAINNNKYNNNKYNNKYNNNKYNKYNNK